jgi:hypothetical protein
MPENDVNVGIGISTPNNQLHIHKLKNDDVVIKLSDESNVGGVILKKDSNQDLYISNTHSNGDIFMGVSGREKTLIITPEGKIGIGTTVPLANFDIRGGNLIMPENDVHIGIGISNPNNQLHIHKLKNDYIFQILIPMVISLWV